MFHTRCLVAAAACVYYYYVYTILYTRAVLNRSRCSQKALNVPCHGGTCLPLRMDLAGQPAGRVDRSVSTLGLTASPPVRVFRHVSPYDPTPSCDLAREARPSGTSLGRVHRARPSRDAAADSLFDGYHPCVCVRGVCP